MKLTKTQSRVLNTFFSDLDGDEYPRNIVPKELRDSGKMIPYIGWFWRNVDWHEGIPIGRLKHSGSFLESPCDFNAIMVNNKWGYAETFVEAGTKDYERIITAALNLLQNGVNEARLQHLWDVLQRVEVPEEDDDE